MMKSDFTDTDESMLLQLEEHDQQALAWLMKKYYSDLFNYARRFTKDEELVKDAIQEVFISLWQRRETATAVLSLRFYLLGAIKKNVLKTISKSMGRNETISDEYQYDFETELSAEKNIIEKQLAEENAFRLKKVINGLSARQKEIIYLKFYQQMNQVQIAELMSISQQSVYNLLHESIQKLKKCWWSEFLMHPSHAIIIITLFSQFYQAW